uniref:Mu-like prophage protein gp16 n=1 Tax=Candidatus Kentrum sp. LFY TaxID=2126342 RepID=A0A450UEB2_9GAMM|nr:MAG: Protein of unknown function (DUF1018) [Candidatus Kentron sp. LFY]
MSTTVKHARRLLGMANRWALSELPGWSDDAHRDLLCRYGARKKEGRYSATTMDTNQLRLVIAVYERRGWRRIRTYDGRKIPLDIAHLVRLWGRLGQAGKVENPSRPALLAFCKRQTGRTIRSLDDLSKGEGSRIIEAMKSWLLARD